jgi:phosphomannomutase
MKTAPYKHLFFDLDNTLTRSTSKMELAMKALLMSLPHEIIVVSGARVDQIRFQVDGLPCYTLGQNGNHAMLQEQELWRDVMSAHELADVRAHIASIPRTWDVPNEADLVQERGSQVSYSLYGHKAPLEEKERFDPEQSKRKQLLADYPFISETVEVKIGGTTCLDYFKKGRNKGFNVMRLITERGWNKDDCIYFGDMLFPGGNDESVIGVIDTEQVENPKHTFELLKEMAEE